MPKSRLPNTVAAARQGRLARADSPTLASPPEVSAEEVDLLSELLNALKVDSSALSIFEFTDPWGTEIEYRQPFSWTVLKGGVWLVQPGREPQRFGEGDTFIFPRGTSAPYLFLSSLDSHAFPGHDLWTQAGLQHFAPGLRLARPQRLQWGGGGSKVTRVVSLAFGFHDRRLGPLVDGLPELMIVRAADADSSFLNVLLHLPFDTDGEAQPGFSAVATHTAQLLLIYLVRTYAMKTLDADVGWLGGLTDPKISRALTCIHRQPERHWTVDSLAATAGMSRSAFAERFQARMGQPPLRYLCAWRMHLAREALASGSTVTALAHSLGYQSEAAFRAAFRRMTGQPPRAFRRASSIVDP